MVDLASYLNNKMKININLLTYIQQYIYVDELDMIKLIIESFINNDTINNYNIISLNAILINNSLLLINYYLMPRAINKYKWIKINNNRGILNSKLNSKNYSQWKHNDIIDVIFDSNKQVCIYEYKTKNLQEEN